MLAMNAEVNWNKISSDVKLANDITAWRDQKGLPCSTHGIFVPAETKNMLGGSKHKAIVSDEMFGK